MSSNRAEKSGIAAEAQAKMNSKYNEQLAEETLEWIKLITNEPINTSGKADNFYEVLHDGVVLCKLVNCLQDGTIKKIYVGKMAFKCMENISNFLICAKNFGVNTQELFQSVDLWERQNLSTVVTCLQSLGRKAQKFGKPSIGPIEATKNVRIFTEEQLRAGDGVISLQYGSNQCATQSGMNMGNSRHL